MSNELSKDDVITAYKRAIQNLYKDSLYRTCKGLLGYKDVNTTTHAGTIKALQSDSPRKLIILPRGCLKSSICTVAYPIWKLLVNPNLRILIDSELYTNSTTYLREIKAHLESPTFTDVFGEFKTKTDWTQGTITIAQRSHPYKESSITCGGVGTVKVGQHYDIIIGDDYNSNKNSDTPEGLEKVLRHFKYNQSILEPNGTYIIVCTRYASRDCAGYVLDEMLGLKEEKLQVSGVYDTDTNTTGLL